MEIIRNLFQKYPYQTVEGFPTRWTDTLELYGCLREELARYNLNPDLERKEVANLVFYKGPEWVWKNRLRLVAERVFSLSSEEIGKGHKLKYHDCVWVRIHQKDSRRLIFLRHRMGLVAGVRGVPREFAKPSGVVAEKEFGLVACAGGVFPFRFTGETVACRKAIMTNSATSPPILAIEPPPRVFVIAGCDADGSESGRILSSGSISSARTISFADRGRINAVTIL